MISDIFGAKSPVMGGWFTLVYNAGLCLLCLDDFPRIRTMAPEHAHDNKLKWR